MFTQNPLRKKAQSSNFFSFPEFSQTSAFKTEIQITLKGKRPINLLPLLSIHQTWKGKGTILQEIPTLGLKPTTKNSDKPIKK